jgi:hypothetical protein
MVPRELRSGPYYYPGAAGLSHLRVWPGFGLCFFSRRSSHASVQNIPMIGYLWE